MRRNLLALITLLVLLAAACSSTAVSVDTSSPGDGTQSEDPTSEPDDDPTSEPEEDPTPTPEPVEEPTPEPDEDPTPEPVEEPTPTSAPEDGPLDTASGSTSSIAAVASQNETITRYRAELTTSNALIFDGIEILVDPAMPDIYEYDGDSLYIINHSTGYGFVAGILASPIPGLEVQLAELEARQDELIIETIFTPDGLYFRNSMALIIAEIFGAGGLSPDEQLIASGQWLRAAPADLGLSVSELNALRDSAAGLNLDVLSRLLRRPDLGVSELGTAELDGEPVRSFRVEASVADLVEAGGLDLAAFYGNIDDDLGLGGFLAELAESPLELVVFVDEAGNAVRITQSYNLSDGANFDRLVIAGVTRYYDQGAADISVEPPPDAVDGSSAIRASFGMS